MPRKIRSVVASVVGLVALVAILASIDNRVSVRFDGIVTEVADATWNAPPSSIGDVMVAVTGQQRFENQFLLSFLAAAAVLALLMLRT
jgi:hypothetical protein